MSAIATQITGVAILLNHLFRRTWKKTLKLRVTGICKEGESTGNRWIPLAKGK